MEPVDEQRENNADYMPGGCTGKGFKPGVSGNPGGRPKGSRSITAIIRRMLEDGLEGQDIAEAFAKSGIKHALKGDFRYWKEIVDRTDGNVSQQDELAKRIADDLRNRSAVATPPPSDSVQAGDGPAAVQGDPGSAAQRQDDDEQKETTP